MNLLATASDALLWMLVALLTAATVQDAVQLRISNLIPTAVAVLGLIAMASGGFPVSLWQNLTVFALVLAVGIVLFYRRILGGGDVKLIAALGLWSDLPGALRLIAAILVCGGLLALLILLLRTFSPDRLSGRVKTLQPRAGIPYGVAIAGGTLLLIAVAKETPESMPQSTNVSLSDAATSRGA